MVYLGLSIKHGDFPWRTVSHKQMFFYFWCPIVGCMTIPHIPPWHILKWFGMLWDGFSRIPPKNSWFITTMPSEIFRDCWEALFRWSRWFFTCAEICKHPCGDESSIAIRFSAAVWFFCKRESATWPIAICPYELYILIVVSLNISSE